MKTDQLLSLVRNKTKRVSLALNPKLWSLFEQAAEKEGLSPTNKFEDLVIQYLEQHGFFDESESNV